MAKEKFSLFETAKTLSENRGVDFNLPDHIITRCRLATGKPLIGYIFFFAIIAIMLSRIDVSAFKKQATEPAFVEKVALATD